MSLIGIIGEKRHGKDTIGDYLVEKCDYEKLAFASPLKKLTAELFDFSEEQINGELKEVVDERWGTSPRRLLQVIGTELFRDGLGEHFPQLKGQMWTLTTMNIILKKRKENPKVNLVVTDCRFVNEVNMIRELGGKIIKVVRPEYTGTDPHVSELSIRKMDNYDKLIINDSTLENLYEKVDEFMD